MSWDLRFGDCLGPDGLATLADGSVDVVITDPPYDEHTHRCGRRGSTGYMERQSSRRATFNRNRDLGFDPISAVTMESVADHCERLTRRWVLVFSDVESAHLWRGALTSAGMEYVRTCFWHKVGGAPQFTGDRPAVACEAITLAHRKGRKRWNGGGKAGIYSVPIVLERGDGERRLHTTQKPLRLMRELVEDFTDPGELVLDPFAGSGTTLVACESLGRRSIGWERDPAFHEVARRRLAGEECKPAPGQLAMFGGHKESQ